MKPYDAILEVLNGNNWFDILTENSITCKMDANDFLLLKYNNLNAPFENQFVRECRGSIFKYEEQIGQWVCVCAPFTKFFNKTNERTFEADYADEIDWDNAWVMEKVDGSLMKIWYYEGWRLSTNGTIDAFTARTPDNTSTFGEIFVEALRRCIGVGEFDFWKFCEDTFDKNFTYMFELTSPQTRVVIDYPMDIYYLGRRNMYTMQEEKPVNTKVFNTPRFFNLSNLDEVFEAARALSNQEEGFVVCDKNFNRIKVKGQEYLKAACVRGNGIITDRKILALWQEDRLDDVTALLPHYNERVEAILFAINELAKQLEDNWNTICAQYAQVEQSKKAFALIVSAYDSMTKGYAFMRFNGKIKGVIEFLKVMNVEKLEMALEGA